MMSNYGKQLERRLLIAMAVVLVVLAIAMIVDLAIVQSLDRMVWQ